DEIGPGSFVLSDGTEVGQDIGYPCFTIGQRKGLGIAFGKLILLIDILPECNTIMLGEEHELEKSHALVRDINLIKYASIEQSIEAITKIRYKDAGAQSTITQKGNVMQVDFAHRVKGIAPGQSAVFYEGNDLLGGGFLMK